MKSENNNPMNKLNSLVISLILILLVSCGKNKDYLVTIHTSFGDMKVILYNETPLHKENFVQLAKEGRYDSTEWHRVIEGFMIQGGNVYEKEGSSETEGDRIPAEFNKNLIHQKGALAAARQGDQVNPEKKSSGSQFYIVQGNVYTEEELTIDQGSLNRGLSQLFRMPEYDTIYQEFVTLQESGASNSELNQLALSYVGLCEQVLGISLRRDFPADRLEVYTTAGGTPHLDDQYTVFGKVVEGLEVIDKIAAVNTGRMDRPVTPIYLTMEVEMISKKTITEEYGYQYPEE